MCIGRGERERESAIHKESGFYNKRRLDSRGGLGCCVCCAGLWRITADKKSPQNTFYKRFRWRVCAWWFHCYQQATKIGEEKEKKKNTLVRKGEKDGWKKRRRRKKEAISIGLRDSRAQRSSHGAAAVARRRRREWWGAQPHGAWYKHTDVKYKS